MYSAKIFQSGNSQAIRIPKELRTEEKEFTIRRVGEGYILYPVDDPWFPVRQVIGTFPDDFMSDREQPSMQDIPDREQL